MKVWKEVIDFRQVSDNYNNRKKSIGSLKESLGILRHETYANQVHTLHLLHVFSISFSSRQTCGMTKLKDVINECEAILLKSDSYENFLQKLIVFFSGVKTY